jgi:hypothetical protein
LQHIALGPVQPRDDNDLVADLLFGAALVATWLPAWRAFTRTR